MLINQSIFPYLCSISLCLLTPITQAASRSVVYPSNLYPGISWKVESVVETMPTYQFRQDIDLTSKQSQPKAKLNQPRYRPLDAAAKPIHSYQYRSEIPKSVLEQKYYDDGTFKAGLMDTKPELSKHNESYQVESEFKQGLPDYQPKPLLSYNYPYYSGYYPEIYDQTSYTKRSPSENNYELYNPWNQQQQANPWNQQPQVNPWNQQQQANPWTPQQRINPWQKSEYIYQNLSQSMPALLDSDVGALPFDAQFHFQQDYSYSSSEKDLPLTSDEVFIVPSHWIQPPTDQQSNTENNTKFTVYP